MSETQKKGMPNNLVFVRHGESEANVAQMQAKLGVGLDTHEKVYARADWQHRLSEAGVSQARTTGEWLENEFGNLDEVFDKKFVSPFIRTRETALNLGGSATTGWLLDDRIVERNWGMFGAMSYAEQPENFPHTVARKQVDPFYTAVDGGESLSSGVLLRFRNFLDTLHREASHEDVLAVTHGELMWVARYVIERMIPEEWQEHDSDKLQKIRNCSVLHYTRINPEQPDDIRKQLSWMRLVYPDAVDESPNQGQWKLIELSRNLSGLALENQIGRFPRLFE